MKRASLLVLIAVMGLAVIAGADRHFRIEAQRSDAAALHNALTHTAEHLAGDLHNGVAAIESLAGFMQVPATQPGLDRFDEFAAFLLARHKGIQALAYVDSNGVIRHFYPKRGNESAIGLDLKRRPAAPFVATAIRERRTTVNHPTRTVQGTLAVIARTPFYRDGRLAGLVQGVFDVSRVVAEAAASPDARIGYELRDAEGQRFFGAESLSSDPLTATVKFGDNHWQLRVGWLSGPPGPAPALLGLLWIGGLLLLASLLVLVRRTQGRELWLRTAVAEQTRALHDSETRYRTIVETAQEGIWQIDADNRTTFVNQKMADMLGYTVEAMHGQPLFDFMDDEGKVLAARNVERRRQGIAEQHEFKFRCQDGGSIWALLNTSPLTDDAGRYAGAFAMITDITERKRSGDALLESQRRLETLMGNLPGMVYRCRNDRDWTLEFMSVGVRALTGHAPEDFTSGRVTYNALIHPDDREPVWQQVQAALEARRSYQLTYRIQAADGTLKWVWEQGLGIYAPDGKLQYLEGFITDITERRHAEQALIQSEGNFRTLTENANVGILVNYHGQHVFANNRLLDMLGYTAEEIHETGAKELVHPREYDRVMACFRDRLEGRPAPSVYETVFMTKTGQAVPVELTAARTVWQGEPAGLIMLQDIRERLRAETQMRKLSSAIEQTADSVVITDREGVIEYVNPAFERTTGYPRAEAVGRKPSLVKSGKQGKTFYQSLWNTILAGQAFADIFINRRKDGSIYYEEKTITPLKDENGAITHFVSTGKDITERMQAQERLQFMAHHDALTELPNRALFLDRLKQAMARARWRTRLVAVLFVDLDRFKTINDTLGHEIGDRLLQQIALRLGKCVRAGDTVARFGGDEFAILLDDVADHQDVATITQKMLAALESPFEIESHRLYITASIGVSLFPGDGEDSSTLLRNADIAMYRAKELGKNTTQFYSADMSARAIRNLSLESNLRRALERGEFRLHYQPQVDVDSGAIVGVEALLRWRHPDIGLVLPADFIPLLEETGLIVTVGEWVLDTACRQLCAWHAAGWPALRMAVNLSPRQFQTGNLVDAVGRALARHATGPGLLEFEITESMLLQPAGATLATLEALRALGVRLAIDDFGTGYSSLSYLQRFPIDSLKIDRSFVSDIPGDPDDSAITTAITALAQSLKLEMIAEGVETEAQRDFLRERGCRLMQGYLFSRPLPAAEMTGLLEARNPGR